jgi:hypothetical protein
MKYFILSTMLLFLNAGSVLAQCGANEVELRVEVTTDDYGGETYWLLRDQDDNVLLQGGQGGVYQNSTFYSESICVVNEGCYFFEIWDTFGDGILAPGGFEVFVDDALVASGANGISAYAIENVFCPAATCDENEIELRVEIATDVYGGETYWTITDLNDTVILEGGQGGVYAGNANYADSICVPIDGCFFFEIWDTYGDGIFAPGGFEFFVDEVLVASGADDIGSFFGTTVHCPAACNLVETALTDLSNHLNGINTLSGAELLEIRDTFFTFPECFPSSEAMILLAKGVIADFDDTAGPLFMTPATQYGFSKNPSVNPGLELEHAMVALQQGVFDEVFTMEVYAEYPQHLYEWRFNSCANFPGDVSPPADSTLSSTVLIRANFEDPAGMNPYFNINGDGTDHALRPTGLYLAPGSYATVTVPEELVGQDYYVRVGSHEWDLSNKPQYKRLDRISKKFPIESTTVTVFNPLGGAISILVPYGATEGNVEVSVNNGVEAPFFSLKSFYQTEDFAAELDKPGPWAVFESENVMYTVPKHSIIPGANDLQQTLQDWETALRGLNSVMARDIIPDKHTMYMICDLMIRGDAFSIGYPLSNSQFDYIDVPGTVFFTNGPGPDDEVDFHELGHALAMSMFPGEIEALVNVPYIMALNYGLGVELNEAVNYSFVPNTYDIDRTATHRMVSNTFGSQRDISNTTTDEVRYQHRGYGHYFEIVNMMGWCPLRNFWRQEYIDFQNGIDHGINEQDSDSRIIRMSVAAQADLRPLFHVFGIVPEDEAAVQAALDAANVAPSLIVYNRLQEYFGLIPSNNAEFIEYALSVYPSLYTDGPIEDPDYGVGWHYLKSLSYDANEAAERAAMLQDIISTYYPDGAPDANDVDVCCQLDQAEIAYVNGEVQVSGGVAPYDTSVDIQGNLAVVTVTDFDNCTTVAEFLTNGVEDLAARKITVYPNPSSGDVLIDLTGAEANLVITVRDVSGRVVDSFQSFNENLINYSLPQASGLYLLEVHSPNIWRSVVRVVKL